MDISIIKGFHDNQLYIDSCKSIVEGFQKSIKRKVMLSFHGI